MGQLQLPPLRLAAQPLKVAVTIKMLSKAIMILEYFITTKLGNIWNKKI